VLRILGEVLPELTYFYRLMAIKLAAVQVCPAVLDLRELAQKSTAVDARLSPLSHLCDANVDVNNERTEYRSGR